MKTEPPEFQESSVSPLNLTTVNSGENHACDPLTRSDEKNDPVYSNTKNFTCLLCDIVCESRDSLRTHLEDFHTPKHYSLSSLYSSVADANGQTSGYMNYRYTCSVCRAKFKSFRTYLTHTMSHRGVNSVTSQVDEARMAFLFGAGKQYMQDYFEPEEGYGGNFTCPECKTDFMQRDAYAMHMMMRAMNETCKSNESYISSNNNDVEKNKLEEPVRIIVTEDVSSSENDVSDTSSQRCLEDVTSKVDQDEYLKSVLDKVYTVEAPPAKQDKHTYIQPRPDDKLCTFCGSGYPDQDSLAMHVMSDHSEEMTSSSRNKVLDKVRANIQHQNNQSYLSWMAAAAAVAQPLSALTYVCKYCNSSFMSRDSLAMHVLTHAHIEEKLAEISSYPRKRKLEEASLDDDTKHYKADEEKKNDIRVNQSEEVVERSQSQDLNKMYCDKCDITFYAISEFTWHMKRHVETASLEYNVTLSESKNNRNDMLTVADDVTGTVKVKVNNNRGRRNSTSSCCVTKDNIVNPILPKRSVSVGVCNNSDVKRARDNIPGRLQNNSGLTSLHSPPSLETVLSNVRALSSNEQRIIYSVFGNDLSLTVNKSKESPQEAACALYTLEPTGNTEATKQTDESKFEINSQSADAKSKLTSQYSKSGDNGADDKQRVSSAAKDAPMCKHCEIVFFNKAIYYLHMGLHNVNNPWQCNACGKICNDAVDFAAHVIHIYLSLF